MFIPKFSFLSAGLKENIPFCGKHVEWNLSTLNTHGK